MSDLHPDHLKAVVAEERRLNAAAAEMLSALNGIKSFAEEAIADAWADAQLGDLDAIQRSKCWDDVLAAIIKAEGFT